MLIFLVCSINLMLIHHPIFSQTYTALFFRERNFFLLTLASIGIHFSIWLLFLWRLSVIYQPSREYTILHYKVVFGADWLGRWYMLFLIPLTGLCILIGQYILARFSHRYQKFFVSPLMVVAACCQGILLVALYLIIQVNIF